MKKLKSIESYIHLPKLDFKSKTLQHNIIEEWMQQLQQDTIDYVVQRCADEAGIEEEDNGLLGVIRIVNKKSILNVADKINSELK